MIPLPDSTSTTALAQSLAEPHLFMIMMLVIVLVFAYAMYRAYIDRKSLHDQLKNVEGRLKQCEDMWRKYTEARIPFD